MKTKIAVCLLAVLLWPSSTSAEPPQNSRPQLYYWVWWDNLEGDWKHFIDFTAEQGMDGVIIWGLQGFKGDGRRAREVVAYAHARNVKVLHGFGLNGYEVGEYIIGQNPKLAATFPPSFAPADREGAERVEWSRRNVFCPSKPESLRLLKKCLLRAAATGIDGFDFETGDVDYYTCRCDECMKRFDDTGDTHTSHSIKWPIMFANFAADVLDDYSGEGKGDRHILCEAPSGPLRQNVPVPFSRNLVLCCGFGEQRYGEEEQVLALNRAIDPRVIVVWGLAPGLAERLRADRENVTFSLNAGGMLGWNGNPLSPERFQRLARSMSKLDLPQMRCRPYRPRDFWAVSSGAYAAILKNPRISKSDLDRRVVELQELAKPGGRYALPTLPVSGNLVAADGSAKITVSGGEAARLVDGVTDAPEGVWLTRPDKYAEAWAVFEWPQPVAVSRIRLYHQPDELHRALDYTIESDPGWNWRVIRSDWLSGIPVKNNHERGWSEHVFKKPFKTCKLRILVTRSTGADRLGLGEVQMYGPDD